MISKARLHSPSVFPYIYSLKNKKKHCLNRLKYKHLISHRPVSYLATAMSGKSQKNIKANGSILYKGRNYYIKENKAPSLPPLTYHLD